MDGPAGLFWDLPEISFFGSKTAVNSISFKFASFLVSIARKKSVKNTDILCRSYRRCKLEAGSCSPSSRLPESEGREPQGAGTLLSWLLSSWRSFKSDVMTLLRIQPWKIVMLKSSWREGTLTMDTSVIGCSSSSDCHASRWLGTGDCRLPLAVEPWCPCWHCCCSPLPSHGVGGAEWEDLRRRQLQFTGWISQSDPAISRA